MKSRLWGLKIPVSEVRFCPSAPLISGTYETIVGAFFRLKGSRNGHNSYNGKDIIFKFDEYRGKYRGFRIQHPTSIQGFLQHQTISHKFPKVLDRQILHVVFVFYIVQLPMAAVAGNNHNGGTGHLYLFHFSTAVVNSLVVVSGGHGTAAATAADLMSTVGPQIHPVVEALIHDPAGFIIKSVPE